MTVILPVILEQLKAQVLRQAGIGSIVPGDCRLLAHEISSKTKNQLSDTTLKRIYGFANCGFSPSLFTLNALAAYCDYTSWEGFCELGKNGGLQLPGNDHRLLNQFTRKISKRTLETLTNGSGIPYYLTVKRKFIDEHLADFSGSGHPATLLTAPAGSGKTIGLCHWVKDQLNQLLTEHSDDNLLFVSSKGMQGRPAGGLDIDGWLKTLLGFSHEESDLSGQLEEKLAGNHRFYLIIDGFDKERFKPGEYELLTDLLLDIIARYRKWPGFKLILTMRSAGWAGLSGRLSAAGVLEDWHPGFMQQGSIESNMLLLGPDEVAGFCRQLDPFFGCAALSPQAISFFGYPLSLQYYYQKHRNRTGPVKLDHFAIYEAICSYFLDKIYLSRLASAKILLISTLLDKGSLRDGEFRVSKLKVYEELQAFREAYHQLLSLGFLREVNRSREGRFDECIELPHQRLLAYCLSRRLVAENDERYDAALVEKLHTLDKAQRLPVLKWLVFNAVKVNQLSIFDCLPSLDLQATEKAAFLLFLGGLIENSYLPADETGSFTYLFGQDTQHIFFYTGIELLGPEHDQLLQGMLQLQPPDKARLWIYVHLAMSCLVRLDRSGAEKNIRELRTLDRELFYNYRIHPLNCLETICNYLVGGVIQTAVLQDLTAFCFQPPAAGQRPEDGLLHLLALNCLKLCSNPVKQLRFINTIENLHLNAQGTGPAFRFFLAAEKADACLLGGKVKEARDIYLSLIQEKDGKKSYVPYMTAVLEALKVKLLIYEGQEPEAGRLLLQFSTAAAHASYRYTELSMICAYLSAAQDQPVTDLLKQLQYRLLKLTRTCGFSPEYLTNPGSY